MCKAGNHVLCMAMVLVAQASIWTVPLCCISHPHSAHCWAPSAQINVFSENCSTKDVVQGNVCIIFMWPFLWDEDFSWFLFDVWYGDWEVGARPQTLDKRNVCLCAVTEKPVRCSGFKPRTFLLWMCWPHIAVQPLQKHVNGKLDNVCVTEQCNLLKKLHKFDLTTVFPKCGLFCKSECSLVCTGVRFSVLIRSSSRMQA